MKKLISIFTATLLLAILPCALHAETITVTGTVKNETGSPQPGVLVKVEGTQTSTSTDRHGKYSIPAERGQTLTFHFIGFTQRVKVTGKRHDVILSAQVPEIVALEMCDTEDIVVVGYGSVPKTDVTGALQGSVSGLAIQESSSSKVRVRGFAKQLTLAGQSSFSSNPYYPGGEEYAAFSENKFIPVSKDPLSTFSLDVDGASYSNMRRMINQGQKPIEDAIRVEEMINYFTYDYKQPNDGHPVKINYEIGPCPWNTSHKLVSIGIKAKEIPSDDLAPTNFVFLIDVSGSMRGRIELVKSSFKLLVNNLRPQDRVAIVVYAGEAGLKLPSTSGSDKQTINDAIDALRAAGSTAGSAGIQLAYKVARENYMEDGNNRIILATDGDFNVGVSSPEELEKLIVRERESGVFLTVLGYGMGNYKDKKIQTLAEKGNGNHAYIDNLQEAHKVLVQEFGGTMHTVAKDVKLQVEFNPAIVQSYRLVGYESRLLQHEDFNNDMKDAAELGVGHTVTAMYEIVPVGVESNMAGTVDPLKYQPVEQRPAVKMPSNHPQEFLTVKLRYKEPDGTKSKLLEVPVKDNGNILSEDFHFASAVAMFGQLLRDSEFKGDATYDLVTIIARKGLTNDEFGYRREFIRLVEAAKQL